MISRRRGCGQKPGKRASTSAKVQTYTGLNVSLKLNLKDCDSNPCNLAKFHKSHLVVIIDSSFKSSARATRVVSKTHRMLGIDNKNYAVPDYSAFVFLQQEQYIQALPPPQRVDRLDRKLNAV